MDRFLVNACIESVYISEVFNVFICCLIWLKYKGKNWKLGLVCQIAFIYILERLLVAISFQATGKGVAGAVLEIAALYGVLCVCYTGTMWRKIKVVAIYLIPGYLSELCVWLMIRQIMYNLGIEETNYSSVYFYEEYSNMAVILCGQMILIFWGISVFIWLVLEEKKFIKEYLILIVLSIYQAVILYIYFSFCGEIQTENILVGWLIYMSGFIIDFSSLYLISGILKRKRAEKELSTLYRSRQEELAYYDMVNRHMEQLRMVRHDFTNQLQVVYGLLEEKDVEKGKKLLEEIRKNVED